MHVHFILWSLLVCALSSQAQLFSLLNARASSPSESLQSAASSTPLINKQKNREQNNRWTPLPHRHSELLSVASQPSDHIPSETVVKPKESITTSSSTLGDEKVKDDFKLFNLNAIAPNSQQFHIGYIKASDLQKVIQSGFDLRELSTIRRLATSTASPLEPLQAASSGGKTSARKNTNENGANKSKLARQLDGEVLIITQKDISDQPIAKQVTRKTIMSPKQAHFGMREKKLKLAQLQQASNGGIKGGLGGRKNAPEVKMTNIAEGGVKGRSGKSSKTRKSPGAVKGLVASRTVPFNEMSGKGTSTSSTTSTTTTTTAAPTTTTTQATTTTSTTTTTPAPTTTTEVMSEELKAAQLSEQRSSTVRPGELEHMLGEEEDDEANNSLAAIAQHLNQNFGGFGYRTAPVNNSSEDHASLLRKGGVKGSLKNGSTSENAMSGKTSPVASGRKSASQVKSKSNESTTKSTLPQNQGVKSKPVTQAPSQVKAEDTENSGEEEPSLEEQEEFTFVNRPEQLRRVRLRPSSTNETDDYDGFDELNEVELLDAPASPLFGMRGSALLAGPGTLGGCCSCAPLLSLAEPAKPPELLTLTKLMGAEDLFARLPSARALLSDLLASVSSEFTLFLPSSDAIDRLPRALLTRLTKNPSELKHVLANHIMKGSHNLAQLQASKQQATLAGRVNGQRLVLADQRIEETPVSASETVSGVVHLLDGLLYPPAEKNLLDTLKACNKFDGFVTLAQGTGLSDILEQPGPYTLFVPSNDALQKIPDVDLDSIRNNMTALKEFLSYHVVDGLFYSNDLRDGQFLPTLLGEHEIQVGVRVDHCQRRLIDANVSPLYRTDIPASNGVIHIVDWILKPSDHDWCENVVLPR